MRSKRCAVQNQGITLISLRSWRYCEIKSFGGGAAIPKKKWGRGV